MVTFPAGMGERQRDFVSRRNALREKLRWTPVRSKRWHALDAELRALVLEELQAETAPAGENDPAPRQLWWQDQ